MSEAIALERWAFLGRLPPLPNHVTLIARTGEPDEGERPHREPPTWPKFDASMCAVLRAAFDASDLVASRRAEIEQMLLDELAGEPLPPWFWDEIDYQMGEAADPIERLPEGLASGHVLDIGDEAFVGD